MSKKKPFFGILIAFAMASLIMLITSIVVSLISGYGSEFALACLRLADGWVFGVLILAALSLMERIKEENFTSGYIIGLVFIVLAILSFFIAITAGSKIGVLAGFICFVLFSICGCSIPQIINHFKLKGNTDADGDKTNKKKPSSSDFDFQWEKVKNRLLKITDRDKKIKLLENTLLFYPEDLDINNRLDFSEPVLMVGDELYTIAAAEKKNVVNSLELDTAKALVASLIKEEK